jgi:hypothetical protein
MLGLQAYATTPAIPSGYFLLTFIWDDQSFAD